MNINHLFFLILIAISITSCSNQLPASIEYNGLKNNAIKGKWLKSRKLSQREVYIGNPKPAPIETRVKKSQEEKFEIDQKLDDLLYNSSTSKEKVISQVVIAKSANIQEDKNQKFALPVEGKIIKYFDKHKHKGIAIKAPLGSIVKSTFDGMVVFANYDIEYGNLVIIRLNDQHINEQDLYIAFAHMQSTAVKKDQQIKKGQIIGKVGETGDIYEPQLYITVKAGAESLNPLNYFKY